MKPKITVLGLCGSSLFFAVPNFHRSGETVHASTLYTEPGGKGSNQAVAAASLGAEARFLSCMGRDAAAKNCVDYMEHRFVKCFTEYTDRAATACASILTDPTGDNQVTVYRGAADCLSAEFVRAQERVIADAELLLLNNECPIEANLAALELAEQHGVPAILNPAPYAELPLEYLRRFALITPNRHEAEALLKLPSGQPVGKLLRGLRALGIERAVITLGGEGAAAMDGDNIFLCPALPVTAVDTTGAGDCFNAALAVSLAQGAALPEAVVGAVNASALSVQRHFVMPSLPTEAEWKEKFVNLTIQTLKL